MKGIALLPSESQEQAAVVQWWALQYPEFDKLLFAIPNGGLRNKVTAATLKKEGVKAGVADLFLAIPAWGYHGLFLEMKKRKGDKQSEEQRIFEVAVTQIGYRYLVAHGADEAIKAIQEWMRDVILW